MNHPEKPKGRKTGLRQTRREFLKTTAKTGAVLMAPTIIPGSALGRGGRVAPSERIVMGGIGIGPRGTYDLKHTLPEPDVQFVAICDVKKSSRDRVKELVDSHYGNNDCRTYRDLREFLAERTDIDALLIATGDRWHAMAAILAMRAGKDVYSEKPSCISIADGQKVVETARRYGRIYQTGTQRLLEPHYVFANELLRTGRLGEIHTVYAHIAPWVGVVMRTDWLPEQPLPPKEEIDWDIWLGPAPWRPYNFDYVKGRWRGHYDFHTSDIGEWGAHTIAQCQVAIGSGDTPPVEYHYVENTTADGMVLKYADGVKMVLLRDTEKKYWRGSCGVRYEGTDGWVSVADAYEKPDVSSPSMLEDYDRLIAGFEVREQRPSRKPGVDPKDFTMSHIRDFLNCVKSRRQTIANPVVMHRSMTAVHAANICMWLKRDLKFDPVKEEFVDDQEANRMRSRAQREPWIA